MDRSLTTTSLIQFEYTPFEFGSWDEPVQAFSPMKWLGTALNNGSVVNQTACVLGFDRAR
jgi:lysophospholipase